MCAIVAESTGSLLNVTPADVSVSCDPSPCAEALGNVIRVTVARPVLADHAVPGRVLRRPDVHPVRVTATAQIAVKPIIAPADRLPDADAHRRRRRRRRRPTPTPDPIGDADADASPDADPVPTPICFPPDADFIFTPSHRQEEADRLPVHGPVDDDARGVR